MNEILLKVKFEVDNSSINEIKRTINDLPPLPFDKQAKESKESLNPLEKQIKEILREIEFSKNRESALTAIGKDATSSKKKVEELQAELKQVYSESFESLNSDTLQKRISKALSEVKIPKIDAGESVAQAFDLEKLNKEFTKLIPNFGKTNNAISGIKGALSGVAKQSGVFANLAKGALTTLNPLGMVVTAVIGIGFALRGVSSELEQAQKEINQTLGNPNAGKALLSSMTELQKATGMTKIELSNIGMELLDLDSMHSIEDMKNTMEQVAIVSNNSNTSLQKTPKILKDIQDAGDRISETTLKDIKKAYGQDVANAVYEFRKEGVGGAKAVSDALEQVSSKTKKTGMAFNEASKAFQTELSLTKEMASQTLAPLVDSITWIGTNILKVSNKLMKFQKGILDGVFNTVVSIKNMVVELYNSLISWNWDDFGTRIYDAMMKPFQEMDLDEPLKKTADKAIYEFEKKAQESIETIRKLQDSLDFKIKLKGDTQEAEEKVKNAIQNAETLLDNAIRKFSIDEIADLGNDSNLKGLVNLLDEIANKNKGIGTSLSEVESEYDNLFKKIENEKSQMKLSLILEDEEGYEKAKDNITSLKIELEKMAKEDYLAGTFEKLENTDLANKITSFLNLEEEEEKADELAQKYLDLMDEIEAKKLDVKLNSSLGLKDELIESQEELDNLLAKLESNLQGDKELGLLDNLDPSELLGKTIDTALGYIDTGADKIQGIAINKITDPVVDAMNELGKTMESFSTGVDSDKIVGSLDLAKGVADSIEKTFSSTPVIGGIIGGVNSLFQGIVSLFGGISKKERARIEAEYNKNIDQINLDFEREHEMRQKNIDALNKQLNALNKALDKGQMTASEAYASQNFVGEQIETEKIADAKAQKEAEIDRELAQLKKEYDLEAGKWFPNKNEQKQRQAEINRLNQRKATVQNATTLAEVKAAQKGGLFTAKKPTLLLVGENGEENVSIMPTRPADIDPRLLGNNSPLRTGQGETNINVIVNGVIGNKQELALYIKNIMTDLVANQGTKSLKRN